MINIFYGGFTHVQDVASATWTIPHAMGRNPVVDVTVTYNGLREVMLPLSIQHTANSVIINFSEPFAGSARLG